MGLTPKDRADLRRLFWWPLIAFALLVIVAFVALLIFQPDLGG